MKDLVHTLGKGQRIVDLSEEISDYTEVLANETMSDKERDKMTKRVQKLTEERTKLQEKLQVGSSTT